MLMVLPSPPSPENKVTLRRGIRSTTPHCRSGIGRQCQEATDSKPSAARPSGLETTCSVSRAGFGRPVMYSRARSAACFESPQIRSVNGSTIAAVQQVAIKHDLERTVAIDAAFLPSADDAGAGHVV